MSPPIIGKIAVTECKDFELTGSPFQVGCQLAEKILRPSLDAVLEALPAAQHEDMLGGVLAEVVTTLSYTLGHARTLAAVRQFVDMLDRMPACLRKDLPPDPEVH